MLRYVYETTTSVARRSVAVLYLVCTWYLLGVDMGKLKTPSGLVRYASQPRQTPGTYPQSSTVPRRPKTYDSKRGLSPLTTQARRSPSVPVPVPTCHSPAVYLVQSTSEPILCNTLHLTSLVRASRASRILAFKRPPPLKPTHGHKSHCQTHPSRNRALHHLLFQVTSGVRPTECST